VAWYKKQPSDATLLRFRRAEILKVIRELGATGEVIGALSGVATQHGSDQEPRAAGTKRRLGHAQVKIAKAFPNGLPTEMSDKEAGNKAGVSPSSVKRARKRT
jgi:hypothetical protein